jgi:L-asparaginase
MKLSFTSILPAFTALASASPIKRVAYPGLAPRHLFTRQDFQAPINASLPNVTIFATGGTIASVGSSNTQTVGYSGKWKKDSGLQDRLIQHLLLIRFY